MLGEIPQNVETVDTQRQAVRNSSSLGAYRSFDARHFANSYWPSEVESWTADKVLDPEFFRFLGFVGIVSAQYGYPSIDGQIHRHAHSGWSEDSPVEPRYQLALSVYVAGLALQALQIKDYLHERFPEDSPARFGVWGLFFKSYKGKVEPPWDIKEIERYRDDAEYRLQSRRRVALPDRDLTKSLAALEFSGDDARRMPDAEFETTILPRVQQITEGWANPTLVFTAKG